ncbi:unnamed protein product [Notodromas monacha]|uniref:Uncharacterized protein n=1 Tax=Notodromas monacha TaxID=399045 RepID=A0A7R9GAP8_9CRUS|nr:unnamed protein product [Notodromas monacha]CAG0915654.1 unnamed protein product [Notodromas monacha]
MWSHILRIVALLYILYNKPEQCPLLEPDKWCECLVACVAMLYFIINLLDAVVQLLHENFFPCSCLFATLSGIFNWLAETAAYIALAIFFSNMYEEANAEMFFEALMLINPVLFVVSNFLLPCEDVEDTLQKLSCFFSVVPILWILYLGVMNCNAYIIAAVLVPLIVDAICAFFPKVPFKGHWFLLAVTEAHLFFFCAVCMLLGGGGGDSSFDDMGQVDA